MPRLRLIAGPNGSGKTTLTQALMHNKIPLGQYLNPDDIARHIALNDVLERTSVALPKSKVLGDSLASDVESYAAALLAQAIAVGLRHDWVGAGLSLTYESVMSHKSHLEFVDNAVDAGFDAYLYYICTSDPLINQERVKQRVQAGGHDVPPEKIESRYHNSLSLLFEMTKKCRRAYFFDNSSQTYQHFAETTPDGFLDIFERRFEETRPDWFIDSVLKKWDKKKVRMASW